MGKWCVSWIDLNKNCSRLFCHKRQRLRRFNSAGITDREQCIAGLGYTANLGQRFLQQVFTEPDDVRSQQTTAIRIAWGTVLWTSSCATWLHWFIQRVRNMLPWISIMLRLPARCWRPSTFWVISTKPAAWIAWNSSRETNAVCPALGYAAAINLCRQIYQFHTTSGLLLKASGVANSWGSSYDHRPAFASRNVGTPDSADIPAPVSTIRFLEERIWSIR